MEKTTTTKKTIKEPKPETQETLEKEPELSKQDQQEVKVIERVIESKEVAPADVFGKLTRSQINLIKRTVAKGASDDELRLFIQVCKGANLNPFLRQVHLVPRWDNKLGQEVRTIQVGIDGFRAVAEESGQYAGNDDPIYEGEKDIEWETRAKKKEKITVPDKATVTVYKLMEGQRYGFTATARWDEYYPGAKIGFQWHQRPYLMLGKCAEALALRKAFPKLLSGMYAAEEMDKGRQEDDENAKIQAGFTKLKEVIQYTNLAETKEWKAKMDASDKYTEQQKAEFIKLADARIAELSKKDEKETKK